jgi:hypothetical protein
LPLRAGYTYKSAYPTRTLADILWLVAHHEGSPDGSRSTVEKVNAFQIGPSAQAPFPGLAYLGTIDGDGTLQLAWSLSAVTWSQGDNSPTVREGVGIYNWQGAAFMFAGNDPTEKQITTYKALKRVLETITTRTILVRSHRDVCGPSDTDCAGDVLESHIAEIQAA